MRNALGASRGRIIAQLFTEALVLTALAAALGTALATLALRWGVRDIGGDVLPFWITDSLSMTTLLYAGLLTLVAAVIVGVLPALRVTRLNVQDGLRREQAAGASLPLRGRVDDDDCRAGGDHGRHAAAGGGRGHGVEPLPAARGRGRRGPLPDGRRGLRAPGTGGRRRDACRTRAREPG